MGNGSANFACAVSHPVCYWYTTMTIKTPYAPSDGVKIPNLDPFFGPDAPSLPDPEPMPDAMQQNPHILYVMQILADLLTDRLDTSPTPILSSTTTRRIETAGCSRTCTWRLTWTPRPSGGETAT